MEEFEKATADRNKTEPRSKQDWSSKSKEDWGSKSTRDWGYKGRWNKWSRPSWDTPASSSGRPSWDTPASSSGQPSWETPASSSGQPSSDTPASSSWEDAGAGAGSIAGAGAGSINQPPKAGAHSVDTPLTAPWTTRPKMPPPPAIKAMPPVPPMTPAIPTQPESHQPPAANTRRSRKKEPHMNMICSICHQRCKTDFPCFLACGHGPWHPACIVQSLNVSWFV